MVTSDRSLAGKVRHARGRTLRSHQFRQLLRNLQIAPAGSDDIRLTDAEVADWLDYFSKGDRPPEGGSE